MAKINMENWHKREQQINTFYEPGIAYSVKFDIRDGFFKHHTEIIAIPFFSKNIFTDKETAMLYIPTFIKELMAESSIPQDVIKDEKLDETMIRPFIRSVQIAAIKPEKIEADGRFDLE